jgi:hypothetical protein
MIHTVIAVDNVSLACSHAARSVRNVRISLDACGRESERTSENFDPSMNAMPRGATNYHSEKCQNKLDSMRVSCELNSNKIDEDVLQHQKHRELRILTHYGTTIDRNKENRGLIAHCRHDPPRVSGNNVTTSQKGSSSEEKHII